MSRTLDGNAVEPRLGPVSYAVLGLIGLRGPSTPYDLKKAAGRSLAYFWPFPHTQLYSEPARLHELGLLHVDGEKDGRRRKTYSLTTAGSTVLRTWLGTPPEDVFEMRDMAVLQLFFSEYATTEELVTLARVQVRQYEARLRTYASIFEANESRGRSRRRMAPLDLGVRMAETLRDFWEEIAENPPPQRP